MRDHILLFVNGKQHRINGADAFLTLSDFLRKRVGLCGTKIVCSEGDCGSCSVLVGTADKNDKEPTLRYAPIDSCIRFVFQLDGCNVVTVEGLSQNEALKGELTAVQQAMIDCHGSQCGFCTPGFVVAMTGILEECDQPTECEWRKGLTGNLCRCTGYSPIIEAGHASAKTTIHKLNECFPPKQMLEASKDSDEFQIDHIADGSTYSIYSPVSIEQATAFLAKNPQAKIVAGATDVGVQFNKGYCDSQVWLDLNRVESLRNLSTAENAIVAGACCTWSEIEALVKETLPQFFEIVSVFGSPQIRNVGTIGGNIVNASPIADSLPLMLVTDAELQLTYKDGSREININDFYKGYKNFDLNPGELLTQIRIPMPTADETLKLYKVSRRKDMDISTFTAAIRMKLDGDKIQETSIAYGAVGPTVLRLPKTETFLTGKNFDIETMKLAGDIAVDEITPISDVRGGDDYRFQLSRNILLKFFHEVQAEGALA